MNNQVKEGANLVAFCRQEEANAAAGEARASCGRQRWQGTEGGGSGARAS